VTDQRTIGKAIVFAAMIAMLIAAAACELIGWNNDVIRSAGALLVLGSVALSRRYGVSARMLFGAPEPTLSSGVAKLPSTAQWLIGILTLTLTGIAFWLLYEDAARGYQQVLPVYLFLAATLICAAYWSFLMARSL
jgi:hypothetical protein